ncbi:hypothetical protein OSTOST_12634 [Ostertagia ostertagi]
MTVWATPFERNPDMWRELWRVVERSDIVVQIVDPNPTPVMEVKIIMVYAKVLCGQQYKRCILNLRSPRRNVALRHPVFILHNGFLSLAPVVICSYNI